MEKAIRLAVFGYDCIYLSNAQIKKDFRAVMNAIKASVDKGIPVLAWGLVNEPKDWSDATEEELLTDNKYSFFKIYLGEYPDEFLKLCDKLCDPTSHLEALKLSLETCKKMFSPHEKMGYGAYKFAINSLKNNKYPAGKNENAE